MTLINRLAQNLRQSYVVYVADMNLKPYFLNGTQSLFLAYRQYVDHQYSPMTFQVKMNSGVELKKLLHFYNDWAVSSLHGKTSLKALLFRKF